MTRRFLAILLTSTILALTGCGGGGSDAPPLIVTDILSDPAFDGDIALDPVSPVFTISQGNTESVFAGIDPVTGVEFRAFLDFPLRTPGGVPLNATISSAFLDIFIDSILPQPLIGTIPIRIDLVSFQPPTLFAEDFDLNLQPALASITLSPPIDQTDLGTHVLVDVTSLMTEAQIQGLADFQLRIMLDLGIVSPGLIQINDTTGVDRGTLAPLLSVTYF
jgi:hypothetical protein